MGLSLTIICLQVWAVCLATEVLKFAFCEYRIGKLGEELTRSKDLDREW